MTKLVTGNTIMGASGANHAPGTVPDPGVSAGTNKFLREDASFAALTAANIPNIAESQVTNLTTDLAAKLTQLTGDVTAGPGGGSQAATLANTAVTAGSYTGVNITVDAKGRLTAASSGPRPFPLNFVQENWYQSGTSNVPSITVTFPQALAASGNTAFMLVACDGSATVTSPAGWTVDLNVQQASFARLILVHKTTAGETAATFTVSAISSFSVYFFEIAGAHALDQTATGGMANNTTIALPAITPTAGSAVFSAAVLVANGAPNNAVLSVPALSPLWKTVSMGGGQINQRSLVGNFYTLAANGSRTLPPPLLLQNITLFTGGGIAYATFSIL